MAITKITICTDILLATSVDAAGEIQYIFDAQRTLSDWHSFVGSTRFKPQCDTLCFMVGNCCMPWNTKFSIRNQMKKLLVEVIHKKGCPIRRVAVCGVLPVATNEVAMEMEVRDMNIGFQKAVRDVKKLKEGRYPVKVQFLPTHKVVLENYTYFDIAEGHMSSMLRIAKPVNTYFLRGLDELNHAGKELVKGMIYHMLQIRGRPEYAWSGIPEHREPKHITADRKKAYDRAHGPDLPPRNMELSQPEPTTSVLDRSRDP